MLPILETDIVRRTRNHSGPARLSPELRAYARWEYNGDAEYALWQIARAGRVRPARSRAFATRRIAVRLARFWAVIAALFRMGAN